MNIVYEYVNVSASDRLEDFLKKKLNHLGNKYQDVIRADVFFKKENRLDDKGHFCNIRLSLPGPRIFASSNELNFELAISETIRDLEDQLKKRRGKTSSY